ncbi:MAG: ABC transporter substrate-binding protein [Desulfitobacteriaceae bacterium]
MKKVFLSVLSVVALSTLLAGCGSGTGNSGDSTGSNSTKNVDLQHASGTIVWAAGPLARSNLRKTLVQKFEEEHPNIKVELVEMPAVADTVRQSITTQVGGGSNTPDVYMGDVTWPAQFGNAQLAMPLNQYLPKSFWDRFAPGLVQGATYQNNIYGAPFQENSAFLFYRKDLLQQAGLGLPQSWDDVKKDAEILQKKSLVKYGFVWQGANYEGLTCDFTEYLADAGGQVLNTQGQPTLVSDASKKALTFMQSLISSGVTPKAVDTFHENESMDVFNSGDAAFLRNWSYAWSNSQTTGTSKVVGKVGVMPLPSFIQGETGHGVIGGQNLYVNPHSKNLAADLAFIDWMTGPGAQTIMAEKYTLIPTNASVQSDPNVKKVSPILGIVNQVQLVSRPVNNPNYPQISEALYTNLNKVLAGSASVDSALQAAQDQITSALKSNGGL